MQEGWCEHYVRTTYRRWFQEGLEPGIEPNVSDSLREIGQNPTAVLTLAAEEEIANLYLNQTEKAQASGIFGSPSFLVEDELFWGDDRLEDAISWSGKQIN